MVSFLLSLQRVIVTVKSMLGAPPSSHTTDNTELVVLAHNRPLVVVIADEDTRPTQGNVVAQPDNFAYKLFYPKFDGEDFQGWLTKLKQYFEAAMVPNSTKVRVVMLHLEGKALQWHQFVAKSHGGMQHDPFAELVALRQMETIVDQFYKEFIQLLKQEKLKREEKWFVFLVFAKYSPSHKCSKTRLYQVVVEGMEEDNETKVFLNCEDTCELRVSRKSQSKVTVEEGNCMDTMGECKKMGFQFKVRYIELKGVQTQPFKSMNSKIELVDGKTVIKVKPYIHPTNQNNEIEKLVKEILEAGIIRDNNSAFASLVVMVKKNIAHGERAFR
ncbi:hypothetical protein GQ457_04G015870 [Hibiscus cannabinus]